MHNKTGIIVSEVIADPTIIKFTGGIIMNRILKNEKLWCVVAGAAGVIIGKKILCSKKTRQLAVTGLAKGMKLTHDAKAAFQSMKDEAEDMCYEAKEQAGLAEETEQ